MYFNGLFDLSQWDNDAAYAVFDDFEDWTKFYQYKQFLGAQGQFTCTDKYRRKQQVRWGKPSILLSNTMPAFADMRWIEANCFIIELNHNKLF